ncbi:hypothetical protein AAMO2058_000734700 [Amorphochlora amoebiformis]
MVAMIRASVCNFFAILFLWSLVLGSAKGGYSMGLTSRARLRGQWFIRNRGCRTCVRLRWKGVPRGRAMELNRGRTRCFASTSTSTSKSTSTSTSTSTWVDDMGVMVTELVRQASASLREFPPNGMYPEGPREDIALDMLGSPVGKIQELRSSYGTIVGTRMAGSLVVLVSDPATTIEVLGDKKSIFTKEGTAFFPTSEITGNGLLVSDGEVWKRQRRLTNPAFRTKAINRYKDVMAAETRALVREWDERIGSESGVIDVYSHFNDATLKIVSGALFGDSLNDSDSRSINGAIKKAFEYFTQRGTNPLLQILPSSVPLPINVNYLDAVNVLDSKIYAMIRQRRGHLQGRMRAMNITGVDGGGEATLGGGGLVDALLEARDEDATGMEDVFVRDELLTLLVAGQETSAIVLAWTMALLAHHPLEQKRLQSEVDKFFRENVPATEKTVTSPDIFQNHLPFLQSVILESMRLYPPAFIVGRCANGTGSNMRNNLVKMGNYSVPKGTTLLLSPFLLHRDSHSFRSPARFMPTRWNDSSSRQNDMLWKQALNWGLSTGTYIPFGAGPRVCIGTGFAMAEALIVLSHIVRRFSFRPVGPMPTPDAMITLRPKDFNLRIQRRDT